MRFLANKSLYLCNGSEMGPRLLLITNKKSYTGCRLAPNSMALDDLERQNRGFYGFSWQFRAVGHIARANCAETNSDRHGQATYEIFSIERRFRRLKSQFSMFKETCTREHQRVVSPKKVATKWLTVHEQELLHAFARRVSISSNFLLNALTYCANYWNSCVTKLIKVMYVH